MKILIIFHKHNAINYNKMLIIDAFKRNIKLLNDNNIICEFFEIDELDNLENLDISKYKNYIFWLHQKIGSYIITLPNTLKLIRKYNIKTVFWMDDLHFPSLNLNNDQRLENEIIENDDRYINVDLIVSPSIDYFINIDCNLLRKTKFLFYFFDEKIINNFDPFDTYKNRINKILLSGKINNLSYPSRKQMYTNYFNNQDIFEWLEHPGYHNLKHDIYHLEYYKKLSEYKGAIVGLAKFPINFLLAKVIEVLGSGCIGFFEASSLYKERLGLEEYIHYIPIEFDENNELIFLNHEYRYILDSEEGYEIAINGYNYVKNNFNSVNFIKNIVKIL
jgi:hypothetical protein